MNFSDPFEALLGLQRALDAYRSSGWLGSGTSAGGAYPPINVFRKGDTFVVVTEVPGIKKSDIEIEIKGNTIRLAGTKSIAYSDKASVHRRERLAGRFDRAITIPVEIDTDHVKAECRDGILAISLPPHEREKPRSIKIS
jgi:HSP20 family protein